MPKVMDGRVDQMLTNVLLAYTNERYFADLIFPTVPGLKDESGYLPQMGNAHLRSYVSKRALYDENQHRIDFQISKDQKYEIEFYDLAAYVPDRLIDQYRLPFDAKNAAQMTVMEALKLERDVAAAAAMTSKTILTNNQDFTATAARRYDNAASTPDVDFDTAMDSVQNKTGRKANTMMIERRVVNALRRHAWFLDISKASLAGAVKKGGALSVQGFVDTVKSWYGIDNVIITQGIKAGAKKGQTFSMAQVWGQDVQFFYRPAGPALMAPTFGYSFQMDNENLRSVVRRAASDKGDEVEVNWAYQDMIVDTDAAYLIKGALV